MVGAAAEGAEFGCAVGAFECTVSCFGMAGVDPFTAGGGYAVEAVGNWYGILEGFLLVLGVDWGW